MKNFNEFIKEGYNDQFSEEYDSRDDELGSKPTTYKIYTSADGIIEFTDAVLEPYRKEEEDKFFFNWDWKENFDTFNNVTDLYFDKDKMFVFMETGIGSSAEYKVFVD